MPHWPQVPSSLARLQFNDVDAVFGCSQFQFWFQFLYDRIAVYFANNKQVSKLKVKTSRLRGLIQNIS